LIDKVKTKEDKFEEQRKTSIKQIRDKEEQMEQEKFDL
jgi:hypothetical protein